MTTTASVAQTPPKPPQPVSHKERPHEDETNPSRGPWMRLALPLHDNSETSAGLVGVPGLSEKADNIGTRATGNGIVGLEVLLALQAAKAKNFEQLVDKKHRPDLNHLLNKDHLAGTWRTKKELKEAIKAKQVDKKTGQLDLDVKGQLDEVLVELKKAKLPKVKSREKRFIKNIRDYYIDRFDKADRRFIEITEKAFDGHKQHIPKIVKLATEALEKESQMIAKLEKEAKALDKAHEKTKEPKVKKFESALKIPKAEIAKRAALLQAFIEASEEHKIASFDKDLKGKLDKLKTLDPLGAERSHGATREIVTWLQVNELEKKDEKGFKMSKELAQKTAERLKKT